MPTQKQHSQKRSQIPLSDEIWILLKEVVENQKKFQKEWAEIQKKAAAEQAKAATEQAKAAAERAEQEKKAAAERAKADAEWEKQKKKADAEWEKQKKKNDAELAALRKETEESERKMNAAINKTNGKFDNMWGQLIESLVSGNLVKLFQSKGLQVDRCCTNDQGFIKVVTESGERKRTVYEADIIVKNSKECVAVEVKSTLTKKKVRRFLLVLKDFHKIFPEYSHLEVFGATAYLKATDEAIAYAEEQGLFVIKATGDSSHLVNQEGFQPKTFCSPR